MAGLFDHAIAFAQAILRADAAADFRHVGGGGGQLIGFAQPAFGGELQPVRDVVVKRAMRLAIGHAALAAPPRLFGGLLARVLAVNLAEIRLAETGRPLLRHVPVNGHELEHPLLGHDQLSLAMASQTVSLRRGDPK